MTWIEKSDGLDAAWSAANVVIRRRRVVAAAWAAVYLAGVIVGAGALALRALTLLNGG